MQSYFRRKRYAAGNICLVLFTAFILTILFGTVGPVNSALAADHQVTNTYNPQTGGWAVTDGGRIQVTKGDTVTFKISLSPATNPNYTSVLRTVYHGLTKVTGDVQLTFESTYDAVYGIVYSLAYHVFDTSILPAGDNTVSFYTYGDDSITPFTLVLEVVDPGGGDTGGGGGGGGAPIGTETYVPPAGSNTPVGSVQVNQSSGTTTINISSSTAAGMLTSGGTLTIANPPGAPTPDNPTETNFVIENAAALLEAANTQEASLLFETGLGMPILLPPNALDVAALTEVLGSEFTLQVSAGTYDEAESMALTQSSEGNLASSVFNLSFTATNASGESVTLQVSVRVELGYLVVDNAGTGDIAALFDSALRKYGPANTAPLFAYNSKGVTDEDKLGVYRLNENTRKWEYVGGKVNKDTKKVEAEITSYGKYAVFEYDKKFADVPASHWANREVEIMAARHVAGGVSETLFQPEASISRIQFAAMLIRSLGIKEDWTSVPLFSDVPAHWRGVAMASYNSGLFNGYGSGLFRPDQNITREEIAAVIVRALERYGAPVYLTEQQKANLSGTFRDFGRINEIYRDSALKAAQAGIVRGRTTLLGAKNFAPQADATRAETCVMLMRMLQRLGRI